MNGYKLKREDMVMICGGFTGFYEWGQGFVSSEAVRKWNEFWNNFKEYRKKNGISHFDAIVIDGTPYLVTIGGSIFMHPMTFNAIIHHFADYHLKELEKICNDVAEFCGGKFSICTRNGTWYED